MAQQQVFSVNSLGGYLHSDDLTKMVRHSAQPLMRFRQFVDPDGAVGLHRGNKFLFDKISNVSTKGGTIAETSTIPKRNFVVRQGSLTVTEYANGIPFTQKLEKLSEVSVPDQTKTVLRNDMAKVLDSAAAYQFKQADFKMIPTETNAITTDTDGTASTTSTGNISDHTSRTIIDYLKKNNVPRYDGKNYIAICSTTALRGIYDYFEIKAYTAGDMKHMVEGEVGTYYGCRFIEETNVLSNTLGSSSATGEAVFFGGDAVREGIVVPEEIRIDLPKDFGRDQAIAWYYLGGFKKVWDLSDDSEFRIIHVTSA